MHKINLTHFHFDVIESMATSRPYRHALGLDKALEEIEQHAGTKYDQEVAAAAIKLFRAKGYELALKVLQRFISVKNIINNKSENHVASLQ